MRKKALTILAVGVLATLIFLQEHNTMAPTTSSPTKSRALIEMRADSLQSSQLSELTSQADTIIVGQVTGLGGQYPYLRDKPEEVSASVPPQRVYSVSVQQTLKGAAQAGQVINVVECAGAELSGGTYRLIGIPWIKEGERYILFLTQKVNAQDTALTYMQEEVDGVTGKFADLSDFRVFNDLQGVILLKDGNALPNWDSYANANPDELIPPIFGVSETVALANIQAALAQNQQEDPP